MPFNANVNTQCEWDNLEDQVRNKVNEIADDEGRNSKGKVTFTNGTECFHWRAGDYRIFGTWNNQTSQLDFIGWGQHVGKGDSQYKVNLCNGTTTRATTS